VNMNKTTLCRWIAAALLAAPAWVHAADGRVVRVIVPYSPGGNIDTMGRLFSKKMAEILHETWVVENRSGANGVIGTNAVAHAPADGSVILFSGEVHAMVPLFVKNVPYDPIKDFQPIARLASAPLVFVANPAQVKANNLADLVKDIKTEPDKYRFAISGSGTSPQVGAEKFKAQTGTDVMIVNYRGTGPAILDVVGGHVNLMMLAPPVAMQQVRGGKLKALAVASDKPFHGAPGVPTSTESGLPGFEVGTSFGYWGPKNLSKEMLERYSAAARQAAQDPAMIAAVREIGAEPLWESPEAFAASLEAEYRSNRDMLQKAGVKPE